MSTMTLPISVCILAKNEEEHIVKAIRSVASFVEEVLVLDTGSTDNTVELAKQAGAKVYSTAWKDNFSEARNELIQLANSELVLMMDADEQYVGSERELKSCVDEAAPFAGSVKIINLLDDHDQSETYITRIFTRRHYSYEGSIHEQLTYNGIPTEAKITEISVLHYGYSKSVIEKKERHRGILLYCKKN